MDKKKIKRLRELLAMKAAARTTEEQTELNSLLDEAQEKGVELFTSEHAPPDPGESDGLSESEVKALIKEGMSEGFKSLGLEESVLKNLQTALNEKQGASIEDIEEVVKTVLGGENGLDKDALSTMFKDAAEKAQKGVTKEEVVELLEEHRKTVERTASKFRFPTEADNSDIDFPIEHRNGNLSVAEKQLLNICLDALPGMKAEQLEAVQNRGIPEDLLASAQKRGRAQYQRLRKAVRYGGKTLVTGSSTAGAELIPSDLASDLLNRMYLESQIASEFIASEIDMPTPTFELPIRTTRPTFYVGSENPGSNPTESSPGTGKVTLTAAKLIGKTNFSYEVDEDAIIAVLPMVTENLASAAADALEGAMVNGDTTGTHQDSDIQAVSNHHAKLFKGIRKYCLAGSLDVNLTSGGISAANVLSLKKDMLRWGTRPRDLLLIAGVNGYNDFIGLTETLTAEKVGTNAARILTGEAPSLYGVRIVVSSQVREDLNASGVYDGSTTTKGSFYLIHRPSWIMGVRRGFTVEVDRDIQQQVNIVVASFRRDFKPLETPSASLPYAVMGRNYTA
jgi:HK97 family phage major capsid protein